MKPRIAITVGDPAGIGPEIARKAADDRARARGVRAGALRPAAGPHASPGQLSADAGRAAFDAICAAVRDAQAGTVHAIATAPVNKLAFSRAGLPWKGHTDLLAHLTGSPRVAMMFWSEPLKVVLATIHVPLAEVPAALTRERARRHHRPHGARAAAVRHAAAAARAGRAQSARRRRRPARERRTSRCCARRSRLRGRAASSIDGPFPGDTMFVRAARGEFDAVIACYHDQGLIPVKLLAFGRAVNVTLGLPIVRTSVDHGTAFDIAGKGIADPSSMIEAVLLAARLAATRPASADRRLRSASEDPQPRPSTTPGTRS